MSGVKLTDIVEKMNLKNLTPEVDITEREVLVPDVNRPALQLAGFFDHFDLNRVQIIGNVECAYLETLEEEKRVEIYQKLLEHKVPCIIFSNELQPDESFIEIADTDEGREIISVFSQVGYTWGQDSDYDGERAAQELLKSLEG